MSNTMARQVHDNNKFVGVRLPTNIKPVHYDLWIKPNFENFTFEGRVKVQFTCTEPAKSIVVNVDEIEISHGTLETPGGHSRGTLTTVTYSKKTETATLEFDRDIDTSASVSLNFTGILNDKMRGFYRTAFKIGDTTVYAATTQFESTYARCCFPCWDEPALRATFSVTLVVNKWLQVEGQRYERLVLSNMNEISRSGPDHELEVKFDKSPIMSTYLLALVVGPFDMIQAFCDKYPVRVYSTPGKKEQGRFALDVACRAMKFYEEYFGIGYPLPKMDLIGIPDFIIGAMENWGLVTFRESRLLVDQQNTMTSNKQDVALVVAHELAHQWFGNLVTLEWWTHLWLKEGFATFMEYFCIGHILPEFDIWSQFLTDSYALAMDLDSLHNSHPIEVQVNYPSEIVEIFDLISYHKGASVIRMLYNSIGDDSFRRGMKDYLTKFAYKSASTEDLWDSLEAASNKPVRKLMSGWTSQKGYPWLSVDYTQEGDRAKLKLTQEKFSADGKLPEDEANTLWMMPISAITSNKPTSSEEIYLLDSKTGETTVEGAGGGWIKLNPGTIGLYRTAYPATMLERLLPAISNQTLPPMDRLGVQSDVYSLCLAGKTSTVELFKLLRAFKGETVHTVWRSIDVCLGRLGIILSSTEYYDKFQAFGRQLCSDIFKKLGWDPRKNESDCDGMTRALIIERLVALNDTAVIEEAKKRFSKHLANTSIIRPDLRSPIYRAVAAHGDEATFESLLSIYRTAELSEEKMRAAKALGYTNNSLLMDRVIKFILSDEVRLQDKALVILPVGASNPPVAWKFVQDNKDMLREKYAGGQVICQFVKYVTVNFASEERAQEVAKFFEDNNFPGAEMTVQQSIETIRLNASWLARDGEAARAFLSSC